MRQDERGVFDDTLSKYQYALEKLINLGIRISDSSRLRTYERMLERALQQEGDLLALLEEDADRILFAFREMDELTLIMDSFSDAPSWKG